MGQLRRAARSYDRATRVRGDDVATLLRLGQLQEALGAAQKAGATYRRLAASNPTTADQELLADVRELVGRPRPTEDEKFAFRRACFAADERLTIMLQERFASPEALRLHAHLAERLSDWQAARARWERLDSCCTLSAPGALVRLARARRKTGDPAGAAAALERLGESARSRKATQAEWRALAMQQDAQEGDRLLREHVLAPGTVGPPTNATRRGLELRRVPKEHVGALLPLIERLRALHRREPAAAVDGGAASLVHEFADPGAREEREGPQSLLVTGTGWSGSGAVSDFLRGLASVNEPFPPPELSLFRGRINNVTVADVVAASDGGDWPQALAGFVLTSVLGFGLTDLEGQVHEQAMRKSAYAHVVRDDAAVAALLAAADRLADDGQRLLAHPDLAPRVLPGMLRDFFDRVLRVSVTPGQTHVLLDNPLRPDHLELLRLLPRTRAIVVMRDPRDQYVAETYERRVKDGRQLGSVDAFVRSRRRMVEAFQQARAAADLDRQVHVVWFEDFVTRREVREDLLREVRLVGTTAPTGGGRFRPEESIKNIGIWQSAGDPEEIARIEHGLAHLLPEQV